MGHVRRQMLSLINGRRASTFSNTISYVDGDHNVKTAKSFDSMPGPKGLPIFGSLIDALMNGVMGKTHEFFRLRHKQYGPIYKEKIGSYVAVGISDPVDAEKIFRLEGKYPKRVDLLALELHRKITGQTPGILVSNGEEWYRQRTVLNKPLLRTHSLEQCSPQLDNVCHDLVQKWKNNTQHFTADDLEQDLFNWALECTGAVMFNQRLGCLQNQKSVETLKLVYSVQTLLKSLEKLFLIPPTWAKTFSLKPWTDLMTSSNYIYSAAQKFVHRRINDINETKAGKDVKTNNSLVDFLYQDNKLQVEEICGNVAETFIGAVETTSHSMQWILHMLSRNLHCQEKIWEELKRVLPPGKEPSYPDIKELTYLKQVVRETLRLYPVGISLSRTLSSDAVIRGYIIPANTLINVNIYVMSRDPDIFENPMEFQPERWNRVNGRIEKKKRYASMPFGVGPRACIGRRLAETEMHLLLAKVMDKFRVEPSSEEDPEVVIRTLMKPKTPIRLRLVEKSKL